MVTRQTLTDLSLRSLKAPAKGQFTVWDKDSPLGVRVSQGGSKTFIVMTSSGSRKTIGRFGVLSLAQARGEAKKRLAEKTLGIQRPIPTIRFDEAVKLYLDQCKRKNRPNTVSSYKRLLGHLAFGTAQLKDISPIEIVGKLDELADRPAEHHHAVVAGRIFFNWCVQNHYIDLSPMQRLRAPKKNGSRDHILTDQELGAVYKAAVAGTDPFHRIVVLLILTGQRKGEISQLQWDWMSGQERTVTLPASVTKNKRMHTFPLGEIARTQIERIPRVSNIYLFPAARGHVRGNRTTVFNGWGKPKKAFDLQLHKNRHQVAPYTLHDLRRTFASGMARLGVQQVVVEKLLNHVTGGVQSPIAQVYNRYSFMDEMRAAIGKWEAHIASL
jgi:integrase